MGYEPSGQSFEPIDLHFARFITQLAGSTRPEVDLAAALLSRFSREGHTCLDLNEPMAGLGGEEAPGTDLPAPAAMIAIVRSCPVVGSPGDCRPLILDGAGRLYLYSSFMSEQLLAEGLLRLNEEIRPFHGSLLGGSLARLFADEGFPQKTAAVIAATRSLCVITGGPGTGKTTLVTRILALLLEQEPDLKIVLAAPTGKAARRIVESVQRGVGALDCSQEVREKIPREASTIHRLLGYMPGASRPRRHAGNPLRADVAVIDEASMADLALMSNLVAALEPGTRLILLGDKNQLASVAAGYVLGDICDVGVTHAYSQSFADRVEQITGGTITSGGEPGMQDSLVELTKTYRFSKDSPIYALSTAVNDGDAAQCLGMLHSGTGPELKARDLPQPDGLRRELRDVLVRGYGGYLTTHDPYECLRLFDAFRVLCPVRHGPWGVKAMNSMAEEILASEGLLDPSGLHYRGRPILVMENDYTLGLFNGDTGIVIDHGGDLRACFPDRDGSVRMISPMRLPGHETAFAMTVHKSQGSEFDRVLLILPDRDSPVLTRELVYTGITRARSVLEIWAGDGVFAQAVSRRTERSSGLSSLLWGKRS
ncbi:MAG TPA: exodeoxyribonuclease V subunit alpha [Desulfomonilia bacterium]|nr:exodeoxyribonuclease V subunit alpha [Desulfomonilia bacterium]